MRDRKSNHEFSVHAIAGTHVVILAFDVTDVGLGGNDLEESLGKDGLSSNSTSFNALSYSLSNLTLQKDASRSNDKSCNSNLTSQSALISETAKRQIPFLGFLIHRKDVATGKTVALNPGGRPIQKFHWGDYAVLPGKQYCYTISRLTCVSAAQTTFQTGSKGSPKAHSKPNSKARSIRNLKSKYIPYGPELQIQIATENPLEGNHGIYFNRGITSHYSAQYASHRKYYLVEKYGHAQWNPLINPHRLPLNQRQEAFAHLSRGLEDALLAFLSRAQPGDALRLAVYEFTHVPTLEALAAAVERGVDVKIVRHCRGTHRARVRRDKIVMQNGEIVHDWIPDDVTAQSRLAMDSVGFSSLEYAHIWQYHTFIERRTSSIMHNKFILYLQRLQPLEVWTGSTNFTDGGIYGQSNVGHVVRDANVARQYWDYWKQLAKDPSLDAMRKWNEEKQPDLTGPLSPSSLSMHVIFSPRSSLRMLQWYADRMNEATTSVHFTSAFGVAQPLAQVLNRGTSLRRRSMRISARMHTTRHGSKIDNSDKDNHSDDSSDANSTMNSNILRYILLDTRPSKRSSDKSRSIAIKKGEEYVDYYDYKHILQNRIAWGSLKQKDFTDPPQTPEILTGLNSFVNYIHTKYMLLDALTPHPTIITGSANFSVASTHANDENMLIIHNDVRVADVYLTEFLRLFDHYSSRDDWNDDDDESETTHDATQYEFWWMPYFDPMTQWYRERVWLSGSMP